MKNKDVIEMFLSKKPAKGSNLYSDGKRLINYSTTLAEWYGSTSLFVNATRYSVSTSKNQSWLKCAIDEHAYIVPIPLYNVPINTEELQRNYEMVR